MLLSHLLHSFSEIAESLPSIEISELSLNSREIKAGSLFIAVGRGVEFIPEAIDKGAVAILIDNKMHCEIHTDVPLIKLPNLGKIVGKIADIFYQQPSKKISVIGITGTNGKTSISHYIAQLLQALGYYCGIIGTLGIGELGKLQTTGLTTPDAISVHRALKDFVDQGMTHVAMEVSSHALDQDRVQGIRFEIAVFSNLTQDHLDYHGDMETYFSAKEKLFKNFDVKFSIINADDSYGRKLLSSLDNSFSYSLADKTADISVDKLVFSSQGFSARIFSPWCEGHLETHLLGEFNLSNVLASLAAVSCLGLDFQSMLSAAKNLQAVPGRMQCFRKSGKPLVIVDYAHTPDALIKALQAIRKHCQGNIFCVFGCGGDRDRTKRPLMAQAVESLADQVLVTSDNPRTENPQQIIADIVTGFKTFKPVIEVDRAKAIAYAIQDATSSDVVLIAGKGHENYQIIGDQKQHFSDMEQVVAVLNSP